MTTYFKDHQLRSDQTQYWISSEVPGKFVQINRKSQPSYRNTVTKIIIPSTDAN